MHEITPDLTTALLLSKIINITEQFISISRTASSSNSGGSHNSRDNHRKMVGKNANFHDQAQDLNHGNSDDNGNDNGNDCFTSDSPVNIDDDDNARSFQVCIRPKLESIAMDWFSRWKLKIASKCCQGGGVTNEDEDEDCNNMQPEQFRIWKDTQYSLVGQHQYFSATVNTVHDLLRPLGMLLSLLYGDMFISWAMSVSYWKYLVVIIAQFLSQICFFTFLLYLWTIYYPECISSETSNTRDAFVLSWTTYSTVGYGHISPSISPTVVSSNLSFLLSSLLYVIFKFEFDILIENFIYFVFCFVSAMELM